MSSKNRRVIAFATQGFGGSDEARLRELLSKISDVDWIQFDAKRKLLSFCRVIISVARVRPDLVVMEGTGVAGGLALILGRIFFQTRFIFSSGDAIAPFLSMKYPVFKPIFSFYERALCRLSGGFIGWTPYLVGRAITYGAPKGVTAAGWAPSFPEQGDSAGTQMRKQVRTELGISENKTVIGIVGSLAWNRRVSYCYGYELVQAIQRVKRNDLAVLIVGSGDGLEHLKAIAGPSLGKTVFFTGRVPREDVEKYLRAMDVASLPQSVDQVGSFRYTTKVSEYLSSELPMITSQIPLAYDLGGEWLWRLRGKVPWGEEYISELAKWMENLSFEKIREKKAKVPAGLPIFDRDLQVNRVTEFVTEFIGNIR